MADHGPSEVPAYKKIQTAILRRIEAGELKPGDAVESERELARIHQVSLMTARHALAGLEREGMVRRRPGAGTFVAPPLIHFNKLMSFTEQMAGRSLSAASRVLEFSTVDDEQEVAARLALAPGSRMLKIERIRQAAEEPFALEICYLPEVEFGNLSRSTLERGSLFSTLERDYGIQLSYADEEVDATAADAATARVLDIAAGQSLLRIRQVLYSTRGKATIYVLGLYRSDRHSLLIRRFR
jgi:GntR family transcriptional regulator